MTWGSTLTWPGSTFQAARAGLSAGELEAPRGACAAAPAPEKGSTNDKKHSGASSGNSRHDNKDLGAAGDQMQLEPKNQIGQHVGRQPDDGRNGRALAGNCLGKGCAGMREACTQPAAARRGAGRRTHSSPQCSEGTRRRGSRPAAVAWGIDQRAWGAACAAVNEHARAASARRERYDV